MQRIDSKKLLNNVKDFVKDKFYSPDCKYGPEPFLNHIVPMVDYAKALSRKLGGDREVIELAAWLHDIGSAVEGRSNHHVTSAKIAEDILKNEKYPEDKIQLIKNCILHHRSSIESKRETIEEKIVAEADAISNFDNVPGIFMAAYLYENKNQREAKKEVVRKLTKKWQMLEFKESRALVRKKYDAILELFED